MYKQKLNLRNGIAVAICLAGLSMMSFNVMAQTPESLVKACTNIPSAATLKNYAMSNYESAEYEKAVNEVRAFDELVGKNIAIVKNKIEELKEAGDAAAKKEEGKLEKKIEKDLLGGKSAKQIENMSQAELMQVGMQMGMQMMSQMQTQEAAGGASLPELIDETMQVNEQFIAESERLIKEKNALKAKHEAMWKKGGKYYAQFLPFQNELDEIGDGEVGNIYDAQLKRIEAERNRIWTAYYSEIIPEWLKFIEKYRADYKKIIPPLKERQIKLSLEVAAKTLGAVDALTKIVAENESKKLPWETAQEELEIISSSTNFVRAGIIKN